MSTFQAPLKVGDKSNGTDAHVVLMRSAVVGFAAETTIFTIPKPYQIIEISVDILAQYTALATMGIATADGPTLASNLDIDAVAGRVTASATSGGKVEFWANTDTSGTEDIVVFVDGAAAGTSRVTVTYAVPIERAV